MKLTLLGSGGWIPTPRRETCCALLREGETAVLVDAGSGVSRLLERPELLDGAVSLDIVLTHFHVDHVIGLSYLPAIDVTKRLWAPGQWLYGADSASLLGRLIGPPLFAGGLLEVLAEVVEIRGPELELGSLRVQARVQERHTHPTLAFRFGGDVAYCTDTAYDEGNIEFVEGVRLLCHEAWHAAPTTTDQAHTAAGEAAAIARDGGVERLALIHVSPLLASDEDLVRHALPDFERTTVGEDLFEWSTPS